MARQEIKHGAQVDFVTPEEMRVEMRRAIAEAADLSIIERVRAAETFPINAAGNGIGDIYKVPAGWEFAARRVFIQMDAAPDPGTPLSTVGVGKWLAYLRSGLLIEYGLPIAPNNAPGIPGIQTWGSQQGPTLRNEEVFQVQVNGLAVASTVQVQVAGILYKPSRESPK